MNATGNPGCTLFNSECTISAGNALRIGRAHDTAALQAMAHERTDQERGKNRPRAVSVLGNDSS